MKNRVLIVVALTSSFLLGAVPSAALAGFVDPGPSVPEPSALLIWAGIALAGGAVYGWRKRGSK